MCWVISKYIFSLPHTGLVNCREGNYLGGRRVGLMSFGYANDNMVGSLSGPPCCKSCQVCVQSRYMTSYTTIKAFNELEKGVQKRSQARKTRYSY